MLKILTNGRKSKSKAMSVQSIIIGSVISGVIARGGLAMLWPRVGQSKSTSRKTSLRSLDTSIGGWNNIDNNNNVLSEAHLSNGLEKRFQSPTNFKIRLVSSTGIDNRNTSTFNLSKNIGVVYRDFTNSNQVQALRDMAKKLEKDIDGTTRPTLSDGNGVISYNVNCGNQKNCYLRKEIKNAKNDDSTTSMDTIVFTKENATNQNVIEAIVRDTNSNGSRFFNSSDSTFRISYKKF